jgi:hypothetical protein
MILAKIDQVLLFLSPTNGINLNIIKVVFSNYLKT